MAIPAAAIAKAAIGVLSNEKTRKAAGWVLVAILSPIILLIAAFCSILGGSADHNSSILDLCFYGGTLPADIPAEYRAYIEDMQASFALLDERIAEINSMTEDGESLDAIRVKAFFLLCISARSHRAAERTNNLLIALSLMRNVPARSIQLIAKTKVQENRRRKPTPLQFPSQTSPQYGPTFKRH